MSDATTGGNNVTAAEYFIDVPGANGTGTAMDAADGTFNSVSEKVTNAERGAVQWAERRPAHDLRPRP